MDRTIFHGRTAIVTGATSGIGEQVAKELAAKGARVVLSGRNRERGGALQQTLGEKALFVRGDVSEKDANEVLVERTVNHFGVPDYLVLSAGYLGIGKLHELSESDWHQTIGTNLNAVFFLLKKALPLMMDRGGAVVIIGSIASEHAFPNHPAYNASKGALPVLVKQIAMDYGPSIRINLVSPAQVETPLLHSSVKAFDEPDEILRETARKLPLKRIGQPGDVASAVLYLLSDEASWVTGTNLIVDGGFLST